MWNVSKRFRDRIEAGRLLGEALKKESLTDPIVLALPRGGVPVAIEVGRLLNAPVDLVFVRKIGVPLQPELAAGAIVDGDRPETVYNDEIIESSGLTREIVDDLANSQLQEIERRKKLYLKDRQRLAIGEQTAIVVDDGLATGATARSALHALRRKNPKRLLLAVPVAPRDTLEGLAAEVDDIICLSQPEPFYAIGVHYGDFHQLTDDEVVSALADADEKASGL